MSQLPQELARFETAGDIVMPMTGASFAEAQEAGVIDIRPDRAAMTAIARAVGYIPAEAPLPPLVLLARSGASQRATIGRWDSRWPEYSDQPFDAYYFSAASIGSETHAHGPAKEVAAYAKHIGARAISEMTIESWDRDASHIGAFATALLLGQRPIEPPKKPSLLSRATSGLMSTNETQRRLNAINRVKEDEQLRQPFIISRR